MDDCDAHENNARLGYRKEVCHAWMAHEHFAGAWTLAANSPTEQLADAR